MEAMLKVEMLSKVYPARERNGLFGKRRVFRALDGVSFAIAPGEVLGLVGESGSGKTTVGRIVSATMKPSGGTVVFRGEAFREPMALERRSRIQAVLQDSLGALNPRLTIGRQMEEPLVVHGVRETEERRRRVIEAFCSVGLSPDLLTRFPHEVSGGQRQRVLIARALVLEPELLVCDEPVSALDVSVQAHVINLLKRLREEKNLSMLFVSHDLRVVRHLCDRVAVMHGGKLVEIGPVESVLENPSHPYTRTLIASVPADRPRRSRKPVMAST